MANSEIMNFYRGTGADHRGRLLIDIQKQNYDDLEHIHDYIQWLFPLPEPSSANPFAPALSSEDIRKFNEDKELRTQLLKSFAVMLSFYGFELSESSGVLTIFHGKDFSSRQTIWLRSSNHNFLRITRILRSLTLLGCSRHAKALLNCLEDVYRDYRHVIGDETFRYWQRALET